MEEEEEVCPGAEACLWTWRPVGSQALKAELVSSGCVVVLGMRECSRWLEGMEIERGAWRSWCADMGWWWWMYDFSLGGNGTTGWKAGGATGWYWVKSMSGKLL